MNSFLEVSIPMDYKNTIITPKTDFPMKAGLPTREPGMLSRWEEQDLYEAMLEKNKDLPPFVLHDGPPFSNGDIHMGHALNKTLKDFIVRSHAMMGYYTPYVPGWDNHGLPIETAIIKKSKLNHKAMPVPQFRAACEEFAETYIQRQMAGFKRLGVVGNWKHPYRTMDKHFEAQEVKVFGRMFDKGYIYKGLKPVYWCPVCATAVAEAEIEYHDDPCTSVYVKFPMKDDLGKLAGFDLSRTYFVIWTTTIWTLPGNLAICLHPRETYVLVKADNGETYIMAEALMDKVMHIGGFEHYEVIASYPGQFFENMLAQHPFIDKTSRLVNAEYVTMDSGTGCVHTAPGFGADDYQTCMRYGMDLVVPVDDYGRHTDYAGKYAGMKTEESNPVILADMKESGALFASEEIVHSYPHHDRCKKPIIFRATPQWFCSVESFKDEAIAACKDVKWLPAWGGEVAALLEDIQPLCSGGTAVTVMAGTPRAAAGLAADLRTKGWELSITWRDQFKLGGKPFHYALTGQIGDYQTEITKYNNPTKLFDSYYEGKKLGEIWGDHVPKLFDTDEEAAAYQVAINNSSNVYQRVYNMQNNLGRLMAGDVMFEDRDGSGSIGTGAGTVDDPGDMMIIGNTTPRYSYSFRIEASWNGFDISAFFQGVGHVNFSTRTDQTQGFIARNSREANLFSDVYDNYWTPERLDAKYPRLFIGTNNNNNQNSSFWMANGRYMRLKNLEIGYTLPKHISQKMAMQNMRVYLSGVNLFTFSPFKLWDPDLQTGATNYPNNRIINIGLTIGF